MKRILFFIMLMFLTLSTFSQVKEKTFVIFTTVDKWTYEPRGLFKNKLVPTVEKDVDIKVVLSKETLCLTEDKSGFGACGEIKSDEVVIDKRFGFYTRTITLKDSDYQMIILETKNDITISFSNYRSTKKEWKTWNFTLPVKN